MDKPKTARRPVAPTGGPRLPSPRRPVSLDGRPYVLITVGEGEQKRLALKPLRESRRTRRRRIRAARAQERQRARAQAAAARRAAPGRSRARRRTAGWLAVAALGAGLFVGPWAGPVRSLLPGDLLRQARPAAAAMPADAGAAQSAVNAAVPKLLAGRPQDSLSLAAVDTVTGVHVGWHADSGMTAASVFKLALLEGYLLRNQARGQAPGDGQSGSLAAMIQHSDNDSADAVYLSLGGAAGMGDALPRLGATTTTVGAHDQWGLSTTTATDQLALLSNLVSPNSPLSGASRTYALRLMHGVEDDQRWGVAAAGDRGTEFANKNGWLEVDGDQDRWAVGSVGVVDVGGHPVLLAVLTEHDEDLADGVQLVESASAAVAHALQARSRASGG